MNPDWVKKQIERARRDVEQMPRWVQETNGVEYHDCPDCGAEHGIRGSLDE